ncbi:hypothetical protein SAMN05519103_09594 [Rhizobiales bacterium GAS113]|nr:hypothetical protein SAMN05519103_09594 [Rhizobiales bacterium GAS113]
MNDNDQFSVTVSLIIEGLHDPQYEHLTARSVTLAASGTLFVDGRIDGKLHSHAFESERWDSFEVKRIRAEAGGS